MSKGEGKEIRSESTGVGGVFRAPLWNLDLILSELEDFEQKRHDHEHGGSMSLKDHSGSCLQMEMNWKPFQKSKDEVLIAQTGVDAVEDVERGQILDPLRSQMTRSVGRL